MQYIIVHIMTLVIHIASILAQSNLCWLKSKKFIGMNRMCLKNMRDPPVKGSVMSRLTVLCLAGWNRDACWLETVNKRVDRKKPKFE